MDEKIIKTAIKNMNTWLDECRADSDTVVMNAKVLRSIRDNYCELLRYRAEVERLQKIIVGFMDEVGTWSNKYDVDISNIHRLPLLAKEDFIIKNKIKSEAVKEFAERLHDKVYGIPTIYNAHFGRLIDITKADMTEPVKLEHNSLCETETYMGE